MFKHAEQMTEPLDRDVYIVQEEIPYGKYPVPELPSDYPLFTTAHFDLRDGIPYREWLRITGRTPPQTPEGHALNELTDRLLFGRMTRQEWRMIMMPDLAKLMPKSAKIYKERNGSGRTYYRIRFRAKGAGAKAPLRSFYLGTKPNLFLLKHLQTILDQNTADTPKPMQTPTPSPLEPENPPSPLEMVNKLLRL